MFYTVKSPWLLKQWYGLAEWDLRRAVKGKTIYLTFDDGPHAACTPAVLDILKSYGAKASFFCIGKNVEAEPAVYARVLNEGHRVGNHTQNHLNGWKTDDKTYFADIEAAATRIDSDLFRPPYGKITRFQLQNLRDLLHYRVIMWDVLSGDFDVTVSAETCARRVIRAARPGSIVVFHDSAKAMERVTGALPSVLRHFSGEGFSFERLP